MPGVFCGLMISSANLVTPEVADAAALSDPGPLAIETGVVRLPSGVVHVAARTDMPDCKGRMLEWWFRFAPDTRQYLWWHPTDHVSSEWKETSPQTQIGSTHLVRERLNGREAYDLQIHFIDPRELVGQQPCDDALEDGHISTVVAAQIGMDSRFQGTRPHGARACGVRVAGAVPPLALRSGKPVGRVSACAVVGAQAGPDDTTKGDASDA